MWYFVFQIEEIYSLQVSGNAFKFCSIYCARWSKSPWPPILESLSKNCKIGVCVGGWGGRLLAWHVELLSHTHALKGLFCLLFPFFLDGLIFLHLAEFSNITIYAMSSTLLHLLIRAPEQMLLPRLKYSVSQGNSSIWQMRNRYLREWNAKGHAGRTTNSFQTHSMWPTG